MTRFEIMRIITGFMSPLCFGILFNIHGKKLIAVSVGGLFSFLLSMLFGNFTSSEPLIYFLVALIISLYCEILAKILKTPATPLITTSLIPLIPGGSLYYTITYAFQSDVGRFLDKAMSTLKLASALALGIIVVTTLLQLLPKNLFVPKKQKIKRKKKK